MTAYDSIITKFMGKNYTDRHLNSYQLSYAVKISVAQTIASLFLFRITCTTALCSFKTADSFQLVILPSLKMLSLSAWLDLTHKHHVFTWEKKTNWQFSSGNTETDHLLPLCCYRATGNFKVSWEMSSSVEQSCILKLRRVEILLVKG